MKNRTFYKKENTFEVYFVDEDARITKKIYKN